MKAVHLVTVGSIAVAGTLLAQGFAGSSHTPGAHTNVYTGGRPSLGIYDGSTPPPVSLPEAYQLALAHIGAASNSFYCVRATCADTNGFRGWTFTFANTNKQRGRVVVFFTRGVEPMLPGGGRMYPEK